MCGPVDGDRTLAAGFSGAQTDQLTLLCPDRSTPLANC